MPAAVKRRKVSATKSASSNTKPLDAFTRVSKASNFTNTIIGKNNYVDTIATTSLNHCKRKLNSEEEGAVDQVSAILSATTEERGIKPLPQRRLTVVPQTPQKAIGSTTLPGSVETPTKGARNLLDRLHFPVNNPTRSPLSNAQQACKLDPRIPELPSELLHLINLHSAFLTALSIHYAHNGTHSPADLRNLCPDVARA